LTWTFPGVLQPGVFRSDPVLARARPTRATCSSRPTRARPGERRCRPSAATSAG
jgi:hypothetical protein